MFACMYACTCKSGHVAGICIVFVFRAYVWEGGHANGMTCTLQLPFLVVRTSKDASVDCLRSSDRCQVFAITYIHDACMLACMHAHA